MAVREKSISIDIFYIIPFVEIECPHLFWSFQNETPLFKIKHNFFYLNHHN